MNIRSITPFRRTLLVLLFLFAAVPLMADMVKVRKVNFPVLNWPDKIRSMKVVFLSDLHITAGNIKNPPFTELPAKINALKPDLILIGGDILHSEMKGYEQFVTESFVKLFKSVAKPPMGIIAVCGNHDQWAGRENVAAMLKKAGIIVPDSGTTVKMAYNGAYFYVGTTEKEDEKSLEPELLSAMKKMSPYLLLSHYPNVFKAVPSTRPVVTLAGHTHGGVARIPGVKDGTLTKLFAPHHDETFTYGFFQEEKKFLYVTSGIGGQGVSAMRFNNPPEIVLVTFYPVKEIVK